MSSWSISSSSRAWLTARVTRNIGKEMCPPRSFLSTLPIARTMTGETSLSRFCLYQPAPLFIREAEVTAETEIVASTPLYDNCTRFKSASCPYRANCLHATQQRSCYSNAKHCGSNLAGLLAHLTEPFGKNLQISHIGLNQLNRLAPLILFQRLPWHTRSNQLIERCIK